MTMVGAPALTGGLRIPAPLSTPPPRRRAPAAPATDGPRPILLILVSVGLAGAILGSLAWRLSGGGEYTIATASMCPDLCVGTLVLDRPLVGPARPGMVVTFRPPGTTTVYTHRIVKVLPDGSFKTAGDALGKVDPWTVPRERVIGRVVAHVRGMGWLWQCLPEMTAALACYLVARRSVRRWVRPHTDVLFGAAVLAAVPTLTMKPTAAGVGHRRWKAGNDDRDAHRQHRAAAGRVRSKRGAHARARGPGADRDGRLRRLYPGLAARDRVVLAVAEWALAARGPGAARADPGGAAGLGTTRAGPAVVERPSRWCARGAVAPLSEAGLPGWPGRPSVPLRYPERR